MKHLTRSALIARPPEQVFALVNDVGSYPQFVPGCSSAEVLLKSETEVVARLRVHRGPLSTQLTTRNRPRPYTEIRLELVAGPLRSLEGVWTFTPVGSNGCRIEVAVAVRIFQPLQGGASRAAHRRGGQFHGAGLRGPRAAKPCLRRRSRIAVSRWICCRARSCSRSSWRPRPPSKPRSCWHASNSRSKGPTSMWTGSALRWACGVNGADETTCRATETASSCIVH